MLRTVIDRKPLSPLSITLMVMLAGLIGCIVTSGILFEKRKQLVQSITESGSENFTWAFNQLRVEFYRLQAMAEGVDDRRDSLTGKDWEPAVRKRYEIFVSRVNTVNTGTYRDKMAAQQIFTETMAPLTALVTKIDAALGDTQSFNLEAIDIYLAAGRSLAPEIDALTAKAVEVDSARLGDMRSRLLTQERYEQINLLFQLVILVAFAGLAFYGLFRLDRQKQHLVVVANELRVARSHAEEAAEAKRVALQRALSEEQRHSRLQRRFVSMASHEFRTPLAIIDSTAQRLLRKLEQMSREELVERINRIRQTVARMGELIETMLEAGRSEEGKTEFKPIEIDIGTVIRRVVKRQRDITPDRRFAEEYHDLPAVYVADPRLVEHILVNLLANAVKYSPKDSEVSVRVIGSTNGIDLVVADRGVGIPAEELQHIGETFFRASTSAGIPGTGVGLNLVKTFVALHGGTVAIDSQVGSGTTFTIHLPASQVTGAAAA